MDRDFALLGLREEATKEEIKAAYERRLARYRAADYADDPDYVRRKITELKAAYESACRRAEQLSAILPPETDKGFIEASGDVAGETGDVTEAAGSVTEEAAGVARKAEGMTEAAGGVTCETGDIAKEAAEALTEDMGGRLRNALEEKQKRQNRLKREYEHKKRLMQEEETGVIFEEASFTDDFQIEAAHEEERLRHRSRKEYDREKARKAGRSRDDDLTVLKRPDLTSLKEKARQLKQYTQERTDELKEELQEYRREEKEFSAEETHDTPAVVLNEAGEQKMIFGEDSRDGENKKSGKNIGAAIQIIIAVVVAIAGIAITGGDDVTDGYLYDDYNEAVIYEDSDYTVKNNAVREMGGAFSDYFESGGAEYDEEWEPASDDDEKLVKAADRFAKLYTGCDSMSALCAELYNEVSAFPASGYDYVQNQVREVFNYYGFPSVEEAAGTVNPYTGKTIRNMTQYLRYLNRYYEEQLEGEKGEEKA